MTDHSYTKESPRGLRVLSALLLAALAVHLLMVWYDLGNPEVFLQADRGAYRLNMVHALLAAAEQGQLLNFLTSRSAPGDYAIHAILYWLAGPFGVIVTQVFLVLASGAAVYRMARLMGMPGLYPQLAAGIYLLLPHALVFPHQLAAEALHVPVIVLALWSLAEFLCRRSRSGDTRQYYGYLAAAALLAGLSILIRPVSLLWPLLVGLLMLGAVSKRAILFFLACSYSLVFLWMSLMFVETGKFGMGEAHHDAGTNLYRRVLLITETMDPEHKEAAQIRHLDQGRWGRLSVTQYLRFGVEYPGPFVAQGVRDSMVFFGKSGVERIVIDYLGFIDPNDRSEMQNRDHGWRARWDEQGAVAAISYLWAIGGWVLVFSLVGSIAIICLVLLAAVGAWGRLMPSGVKHPAGRTLVWIMVTLPLYLLAFSSIADGVQSRYRAQAEGVLVILAVWAIIIVRTRLHARQQG